MDEEAETGDTKKRGVLAKVFGGCFPWLASSEELEVDAQEAAKFNYVKAAEDFAKKFSVTK